jgi:hypothetical protein
MRGNLLTRIIISFSLAALAVPTQARAEEPKPPATFAEQYNSLAAAMLNFYANSSGSNVQSLLNSNSPQVANILGSPTAASQIGQVSSAQDLQSKLMLTGVSFDFSKINGTSDLFAEVRSKASTIDGQVTLFGAQFATLASQMRTPTLSMPTIDGSSLPAPGSQIPLEGLAFGLFMNKSLTNLVANHPDVFAQVKTSGLGTPAAFDAWKSSMLQAGTTVGSDLSRLPMPCLAEMLQGMGSGVSTGSSSSCGSCSIAGAYLHNQASNLLDPNANTALPGPNSTNSSQTQPWLQNELNEANPGLSSQLNQVFAPNSAIASCSSASSSVSSVLSSALPGLFSGLGPNNPQTPSSGFSGLPPSSSIPAFPGGFGLLQPSNR